MNNFPFKDYKQCRITSPYGVIRSDGLPHDGLDIVCDAPDKTVLSITKGTVIRSNYKSTGWGQHVVIQSPNGIAPVYGHMIRGSQKVKVGDVVQVGTPLGTMGNTGNSSGAHLHIELQNKYYEKGNVSDIAEYLGIKNIKGGIQLIQEVDEEMVERFNTFDELPDWSKNSIKRLIEKGLITKSDKMDLSYDMIRILVVLARTI